MGLRYGKKLNNKYSAKRVSHAGYSFASKLEAAVFDILKLRECAGEIKDIQCQAHVKLTKAKIVYIPDFKFTDVKSGEEYYAEAKDSKRPTTALKGASGCITAPARLKYGRVTMPGRSYMKLSCLGPQSDVNCHPL